MKLIFFKKHQHFLNGIDYVTRALGYSCRHTPGKSNNFLLVLELERAIQANELSLNLAPYSALLHGSFRRNFLLAPHWKPGKAQLIKIEEGYSHLNDYANQPLTGNTQIGIAVIDNMLVFKFSHQIFDARGAEMFVMNLFNNLYSDSDIGLKSPDLCEWKSKFSAGRTVNRLLIALRKKGKVASLVTEQTALATNNSYVITLNSEEITQIKHKSEDAVGPFMLGGYLAAIVAWSFEHLKQSRHIEGNVMLPMSIDLRGISVPNDILFFNQWSVSPLYFSTSVSPALKGWLASARQQIIFNTSNRIPQAFRQANMLTRIVPLRLMKRLMATLSGSTMFSFLPDSLVTNTECSIKIKNLYHLPLMPPEPGIGVFVNVFEKKMNIVLSWREGVISLDEAQNFARVLRLNLLTGVEK